MGYGGLINTIADPFGIGGGNYTPSTPKPGKISKDYLDLIRGFAQGQGTIFDTEAKYGPKYIDMALGNLGKTVPAFTNIMTTASPGAEALVKSLRDPGTSKLRDSLTTTAQSGLDEGANIDPELMRIFSQGVRGGQADRGLGNGPSDVLQESLGLAGLGQNLRQQRQGFAKDVTALDLGQQNQDTGNTLQVLTQLMGGGNAVATGSGPTLIPANQNYDLFNTTYNAKAAANIAGANNKASVDSSY